MSKWQCIITELHQTTEYQRQRLFSLVSVMPSAEKCTLALQPEGGLQNTIN